MVDSPITFTVQLTQQDLVSANLWLYIRKRWWLYVLFVVLALVAVVPIILSSGPARDNLIDDSTPLFVLILFWFILIPVWIYFGSRSRFREQKGLRQANRYTVSDAGIQIESESSSERMDWSHIYSVFENKTFIFLHISKTSRLIITKNSLPDEGAIRVLRELIREHVKGKVRLLA